MIICKFCKDIFKYSSAKRNYREHFENFHSLPKINKDGTIQLNAVHQITLIIKSTRNWKQMLKREEKRSKQFGRVDEAAIKSIKELDEFERKNNIKFSYRSQTLGFSDIVGEM